MFPLPSPKTKADPPLRLDTAEEIDLALRREEVLAARAERRLATASGRIENAKQMALLVAGIAFFAVVLVVLGRGAGELLAHPEAAQLYLLAGGGVLLTKVLVAWIRSDRDSGGDS